MKINTCFSPALYPYYTQNNDRVVVVVDVFRATTTMCAALQNGASSIIPVATLEEAKQYKDRGYLVGGERNIVKFEFGDFGNTPSEYVPEKVAGREIVISTTNGTHAIDMAKDSDRLIIGSFSNISTVANYCINEAKDVLVLCAGWQDKFNLEDTLFAGALAQQLVDRASFDAQFDATTVALSMWQQASKDMMTYIARSEHWNRMKSNGLEDVAKYCLQSDTTSILPKYEKHSKKIAL